MALNTYVPGEAEPADGWLISTWDQGFSPTEWQADNVFQRGDATVLRLDTVGGKDPYVGGEVQSTIEAATGTWSWHAKAPDMVPGTVFGLFVFQADWRNPHLEFDFEIVGDDPTTVEIVTHMTMADGRHQSAMRKVKLDFDPSDDFNLYELSLDGRSVTFRINGSVVATFDSENFGGYWRTGEVRSYASIWAPGAPGWAGTIDPQTPPIEAEILSAGWSPGMLAQPVSWIGTSSNDYYHGSAGDDSLTGGDGADQINGETGRDWIWGGTGNDTLHGWNGGDCIFGETGNDTIMGNKGDDTLDGGAGDDVIAGEEGHDTIVLSAGTDRINGGAGSDWVVLEGTTGAIIDLGSASAQTISGGQVTLSHIENARGGAGADWLNGTGWHNTLDGGAGTDTMLGGAGDDTYVVNQSTDKVLETISISDDTDAGGLDTVRSGVNWTLGPYFDYLVLTGRGNLSGTGNIHANQITGNAGANILSGREGSDRLWGQDGNDRVFGDSGNDQLYGETGNDTLDGGAGKDLLEGGGGNDVYVILTTGDTVWRLLAPALIGCGPVIATD